MRQNVLYNHAKKHSLTYTDTVPIIKTYWIEDDFIRFSQKKLKKHIEETRDYTEHFRNFHDQLKLTNEISQKKTVIVSVCDVLKRSTYIWAG